MLDTVTMPATTAPRRLWTRDDDFEADLLHNIGSTDEEIGHKLGRSAKAVHHRRMRLAIPRPVPAPPAPVGHELARAAADIDRCDLALEAAHRRYAEIMSPYVRAIAGALRVAGICATAGDDDDYAQGNHAWELVEALVRVGIDLKVPA